MDNIIGTLGPGQVTVDLGCGQGSFNYSAYKCNILGVDLDFETRPPHFEGDRIAYVKANSHELPLKAASVDAIVCNHSLEHIIEYKKTLAELSRVLKPDGLLWVSVPNGSGLDDRLYRFLYAGGGHVNRFTFETIKKSVESATGRALLQSNLLSSGFVYCTQLPKTSLQYLPPRRRLFFQLHIVNPWSRFLLNGVSRFIDKTLHTRLSAYGWGFVFGQPGTTLEPLRSYFNVCAKCGCGNAIETLQGFAYRSWGLKFYKCPLCKYSNLLFEPPIGFD